MDEYLVHHGILGQKWGIRRYQNPDGTLIKKGTIIKRIATSKEDPTYDNKKYVSINEEDHKKWDDYIGNGYLKSGYPTYSITYKTTKDLKVMSVTEQGKKFAELMMNKPEFRNVYLSEQHLQRYENLNKGMEKQYKDNPLAASISVHMAAQTEIGKMFIKEIMKDYDALEDYHGQNEAEDPIIVLNPDKNLKKIDSEYSKAVIDYLNNTKIR